MKIEVLWKVINVNFYNSDYLFYIKVRYVEDFGVFLIDVLFLIGYLLVVLIVG